MDTIQRFFALLRSGLWGKAVESSLFADGETDWDAIISMSMEQTVTALVFDGNGDVASGFASFQSQCYEMVFDGGQG